jgi:NitT/TauT family transport system ATP-binding protein/sulfonate transport system ATP-binding protein
LRGISADLPGSDQANGTPELELRGVQHTFGGRAPVHVLDAIDLSVRANEFVSIIGPSGCGKSTTLFIAAGLIKPTAGQVYERGKPIQGPDRNRGMIFQSDAVFPWLTVRGNVEFGLKRRGVPRRERDRIVAEYVSRVGLADWLDRYPRELSGGMRKRVDIARVFANGPRILLLDESFGQLDTQTKERLQIDLLDMWERERKTVVFVTHDIEEALFLADRVIVMSPRPGRFIRDLVVPFERPRHPVLKTEPRFQEVRREVASLITTSIEVPATVNAVADLPP